MAKLFKCDVTGATCEGDPAGAVTVDLVKDAMKAEVRLFVKKEGHFAQADLGPEAVAKIQGVLAEIAPKAVADVKGARK
jgi:hypothetical protein